MNNYLSETSILSLIILTCFVVLTIAWFVYVCPFVQRIDEVIKARSERKQKLKEDKEKENAKKARILKRLEEAKPSKDAIECKPQTLSYPEWEANKVNYTFADKFEHIRIDDKIVRVAFYGNLAKGIVFSKTQFHKPVIRKRFALDKLMTLDALLEKAKGIDMKKVA